MRPWTSASRSSSHARAQATGAGTSSAAGLPGWKRLVELAIAHARGRSDPAARIAEMEELMGRGELVDALSVA
ncbi:hypothetical protein [Hyalangium gracile]|uniref:hypothetical protein n=1 Tax=Hyalangium gracile TaxID=394092 RepID=UPI001CCEEB28|nr:hypothetical protein [Hyalangium gracile]